MVKVRFLYHALSHGATNLNKINGGIMIYLQITLENEDQKKIFLEYLEEGETEGRLDFAFNVKNVNKDERVG
tara:strand:+ start:289 stop:504 length:216 start_codon:yes stop_codon:yes gene_type:complete